jgi:hypothetical protein
VRTNDGALDDVLVFFDPGSQLSFAEKSLVDEAGTDVEPQVDLQIHVFGEKRATVVSSRRATLTLDGPEGLFPLSVWDKPSLGVKLETVPDPAFRGQRPPTPQVPQILIGINDFWKLFLGAERQENGLTMVSTLLGDVHCGCWDANPWNPIDPQLGGPRSIAAAVRVSPLEDIPECKDFWALETIGVTDDPAVDGDIEAMKIFDSTVQRQTDGRYEVAFPWIEAVPDLASNYNMAFSRLQSVFSKLTSSPKLKEAYGGLIQTQLDQGMIEVAHRTGAFEHYLPHHPVITHKIRIVYDGSARSRGAKSLNQCLHRGPVILPDLVGLLMCIRAAKYPILADVEKAFLQLSLREADREVTKFLWVKDVEKPPTPQNLEIYRFARVPFGIISSPFLLGAVIQKHLETHNTPLANEIRQNVYVDNVLLNASHLDDALQKVSDARKIFAGAKMNLQEFTSNLPGFDEALPLDLKLPGNEPKVLGIKWKKKPDVLEIPLPARPIDLVTRRTVLQAVAGIYDPLGLVAPCTLLAKLFFQTLWSGSRTWDSPVSKEEEDHWRLLEAPWQGATVATPRLTPLHQPVQLHVFVDASKDAYSCLVYIRGSHPSPAVPPTLVFSKCRLRPKKQ